MTRSIRSTAALGVAVLAVALALAALAGSAHAARGIDLGLSDSVFGDADAGVRATWLDRADDARADLVILGVGWAGVAPASPPPGFDPRDPGDPAYDWGEIDAAVRDADARGFDVLLFVGGGAPAWAEGANRPGADAAPPGTWKPDPDALGDFGRAVAARFSGGFTPPGDLLGALPRVSDFQLWGEVNLSTYLTPQFKRRRQFSAKHYRKMLNAFYAEVKSVHESNLVVTGGTAPYGDPSRRGGRTQPVRFWRKFFCLKGRKLEPAKCRKPARFDVLAHHPINVGKPRRHARSALDASTPDIGRIKKVLRAAEKRRRAKGAKRHPIWATEIWWDSNPPDPDGVKAARHARWLQESLYLLWKQGVKKVVWFLVRDQDSGGNYAATVQSGLFLRDGGAKPAFDAFRFPFVADRKGRRGVLLWGKAPGSGEVTIERRRGGGWDAVAHAQASSSHVFKKRIGLRGKATLRARQGGEASLAWAVK